MSSLRRVKVAIVTYPECDICMRLWAEYSVEARALQDAPLEHAELMKAQKKRTRVAMDAIQAHVEDTHAS